MNAVELAKLEALTKDYAAFQARKSGLATALGGLMVMVMALHVAVPPFRVMLEPWMKWQLQAVVIFVMPLLWQPSKLILGQWLYRGLGEVKPIPNAAIERKRWLWIFGIALFLFAFQTIVLLGFVSGYFNILRHPEQLNALRKIPLTWQPWLWVATLPWLYLVAVPWCVRGVEEAKTYAVLVGQGVIWIAYAFNREGFNVSEGMKNWLVLMFLGLQVVVLIWAVLTVKRGWREHREYLAILRSLPREEV